MQDTKYNPVYPPISETPYINQHIGSLSAPFNKESATSDSALTSEEPKRRNFLKVLVPEHNNACGGPPGSFNREGNFYVDDFPPLPGGSESGGCELLLKAVSAGAGSWERNGGAVRVLGAAGKREDHGFEAAEKAYGVCEGEWYAGEEEWSDNGLGFGEEYMPPLEKVLRARLKGCFL